MPPPIPRHLLAISIVLAGVTSQTSAHASAAVATRADMTPVLLQSDGTYRSVPLSEVHIGGPDTDTHYSAIAIAAQGEMVNVSQLKPTDQSGTTPVAQNTNANAFANLPGVNVSQLDRSDQPHIALGAPTTQDATVASPLSFDAPRNPNALNEGTPQVEVINPARVNGERANLSSNAICSDCDRTNDPIQFIGTAGSTPENHGVIELSRNNSTAVLSQFGSLINNGSILIDGNTNIALRVRSWGLINSATTIENHGTIAATGSNSIGVDMTHAEHAELINTGTIKADGTAVNLDAPNTVARYLQSAGLTSGTQTSIQGNFYADPLGTDDSAGTFVGLSGGRVQGDIQNIWTLETSGNVTLDAQHIGTRYLTAAGGRLSLAQPHTQVSGNLQLIGAELELPLSNSTDAHRPALQVAGYAEVTPGSHILLTPKPGDFATQGSQVYQLIQAGRWYTATDEESPAVSADLNVISTSALMTVESYDLNDNLLSAKLHTLQSEEAVEVVEQEGGSKNAQEAIGEFTDQIPHLTDNDPIYEAIANADAARMARLAREMQPEINGGAWQAATAHQQLLSQAIERHTQTAQLMDKNGVWVQALNGTGKQGERQQIDGFDFNASGIAVGVDHEIAPQTIAGLAYSYLNSNIRSDNGNKTDVSGQALSLYGAHQSGPIALDAYLTYGWNDNESKRYVATTRARGDYDSDLLGAGVTAGYRLDLGGLNLEPRAGIRYNNVKLASYNEKGSSAALHVDSQRYESGELGAGLRLSKAFSLSQGILTPSAQVMAWHDVINDHVETNSAFLIGGTSFVSQGVRQSRETYEAQLGVSYRVGAVSAGVGYNYAARSSLDANGLQAQASYLF